MNKTLREIYNYDFIENPETALLEDINKLLNKAPDELDIHDICVLIRQEMFLDLAIPKAIELIKINHAAGDYYNYSLLFNLSKLGSLLDDYKNQIESLVEVLEKDLATAKFELDSEKEDYLNSIENLKITINK